MKTVWVLVNHWEQGVTLFSTEPSKEIIMKFSGLDADSANLLLTNYSEDGWQLYTESVLDADAAQSISWFPLDGAGG